jgi:homoserine O-acetyltransferase/O-succinyltransferase
MTNLAVRLAGFFLLAILFFSPRLSFAQIATTDAEAPQKFADFGVFKLQSGQTIRNFRLGYRTAGNLNAEKSNAVLWLPWLGGRSQDLLQYVGPANVVDTTKYFAILVDPIGDGISTSPSNSALQSRMRFPQFTIRDIVEAEHRLVADELKLTHLHAVIGISMGGMQAFEWLAAYPEFMDSAVSLSGSPQTTSYDKLQWQAQIDALELDPNWKGGNGRGPMKAGFGLYSEINSMNITSPEYRVEKTPPKEFDAFLAQTRKTGLGDAAAACDAIRQRQAIMSLDILTEFGITMEQFVKRSKAKVLVFISPEDHMVNPTTAIYFAKVADAPLITLDSACGHTSFACIAIGPTVAQFLAEPGSVHSMTLKDANR